MRRQRSRRFLHSAPGRKRALALVAALGLPLLGPVATPAGAVAPRLPALHWRDCAGAFECATALVPLDYDRPDGRRIQVALIRLPASDAHDRIGSLFVNPGGPGGSGVDLVLGVGPLLGMLGGGRYDIVGFDPRGVARSTPLRCFASPEEAGAADLPFPYPVTDEEVAAVEASDRLLAEACSRHGRPIVGHMSTANVARDLDLLRGAVGDESLNFLGVSYGTYLGATYANLFPGRVGAFVLDGVIDPVAWSTGRGNAEVLPFSARLGSAAAAQAALGELFRLCDEAGTACAFSGGAEQRFAALAERLRAKPIVVPLPDGGEMEVTYAALVALSFGALYSPESWPEVTDLLAALDVATAPAEAGARLVALAGALGLEPDPGEPEPSGRESLAGVACADTDNPSSYGAVAAAARSAEAQPSYFGPLLVWIGSICAVWPAQDLDRYVGPWDAETAGTVLVIGNLFDPVTPYAGAVTLSELLPNSRLLTYAGWGHAAIPRGSPCVIEAVSAYLVFGAVPPEGAVCPANLSPFLAPPPDEGARQVGHALSRAALPEPVAATASVDSSAPVGEEQRGGRHS